MGRKTKRKRKSHTKPARRVEVLGATGEERRAEAITIIWMLSAVATLAAELVTVVAHSVLWFTSGSGKLPIIARVLPGWFILCATLTGIVCLALTPLVYRVRRVKPPRSITLFALLISLAPLVVIVGRWWI